MRSQSLLENLEISFLDTTTSYFPGRIFIFSTLKLKTNSEFVSPTMIEKSLEVSFFLSRTTSLTTPDSPTAEISES